MLSALRSGDPQIILLNFGVYLMIIFLIIPVHEYAHAWMAYKMGDDTAAHARPLRAALRRPASPYTGEAFPFVCLRHNKLAFSNGAICAIIHYSKLYQDGG